MTTKPTDGLQLARGLVLPLNVATQKLAFIGRSGSGKTYGASKLVELMLQAGIQVIVLDGVGVWYGLRLGAHSKTGFDIPIFGGLHGDIPLEPTGGELIADLLVDRGISAVLDVSMMRKGPRKQFVTLFAEQFFQRKKERRSPVHIVIEESQMFVPQRPQQTTRSGGISDGRMKGAFEDLTKIGRNFGIGHTLITQRPQAVDKDVLNQIEVLFAFQTNGVHEKKAIRDWVTDKGLEVDLIEELPGLEIGQPWVWSPQWLRITKKIRINQKVTADTSSTPENFDDVTEPVPLASVDMEQLQQDMAATIERAKAEDPKELRKEISRLKRDLHSAQQATPEPQIEHVEVSVLKDEHVTQLHDAVTAMVNAVEPVTIMGREITEALIKMRNGQARQPVPSPARRPTVERKQPVRSTPVEPSSDLTGPEQRIIDAIAWMESIGIDDPNQVAVAFLAGYKYGAGGYNNPRGRLRQKGMVGYRPGNKIALTDSGRALANTPGAPLSVADLHERVLERLPNPEQRLLRPLLDAYPDSMGNEELAKAAGYAPGTGGYNNPRGRLRSLGLVGYPEPGYVVAEPLLFLEGAPA